MIESPFSRAPSESQKAVFGTPPFLTTQSNAAEIKQALETRGVDMSPAKMRSFSSAFKNAAANLLEKVQADNEKGALRPSVAVLLKKHGMENGADKISPSLAEEWSRKMTKGTHSSRQKSPKIDPVEAEQEDRRCYWTDFLGRRQGLIHNEP